MTWSTQKMYGIHAASLTQRRNAFPALSPNGGNPICKPQLPQGLPVPVTGEHRVFAGWLQHSCWLTHSPNCPWASWNSQPIWLSAYAHTHMKTLHRFKGGRVNNAAWPNCSWENDPVGGERARRYRAAENDSNAVFMQMKSVRQVWLCVRWRMWRLWDSCCLSCLSDSAAMMKSEWNPRCILIQPRFDLLSVSLCCCHTRSSCKATYRKHTHTHTPCVVWLTEQLPAVFYTLES